MTEPVWYAVHDLPVFIEQTDGAARARALDLDTGAFVDANPYLAVVAAGGPDVEPLEREEFDRVVRELRRVASHDRQVQPITWDASDDPEYDLRAQHGTSVLRIRTGDYPVRARYVIVVDGQEVDRLDMWPSAWSKGFGPRNSEDP